MANKRTDKPAFPSVENKISEPEYGATKRKFSINLKLIFFLGAVSFLVYANTLKNGFVLDDSGVITHNVIVTKGVSAIPEILATPYRKGYGITTNDLYRPLSLVMFAMEYRLFTLNPLPYHFINILLFSGCVILLFLFLDRLFQSKKTSVAFIASLLFALHPIHTEVVANIKSGDELLCFFFAFLSLNVFVKYTETGKIPQLLLGALCFLLSIFSKETVISFLAVIPLVFFYYRNENKKRSAFISLSVVFVAILFLTVRYSVLSTHHANNFSNIDFLDNILVKQGLSAASRLATAILILGYYIKLLFVPYPLICDYSYNSIPLVNFSDPVVLISLAAYIALVVFGITRLIKNNKDPYAFSILFFLVTIALFSNILFLIGAAMAERFIFFASAGFCLLAALLIDKWAGSPAESIIVILKRPKVLAILIPLSLIYSIITVARNNDWTDNYTLYKADTEKSKNDARLYYYLGTELAKNLIPEETDPAKQKQIREEAITAFRRSMAIYPDFSDLQCNLGNAYLSNGQYDSAEVHEKRAIELNPKNNDAIIDLAGVYFAREKYQQVIELSKKAIEISPEFVVPYANIGLCYLRMGNYDSAIYYLGKTLTLDPGNTNVNMQLGVAYSQAQKYDLAEPYFKKAIDRNQNDIGALYNLGLIYSKSGKLPEALELFKRTTDINPDYVRGYSGMAQTYYAMKQYEVAVATINKALALDPNDTKDIPFLALSYKALGKMDSAQKYEAIAQKVNPEFKL